MTRLISILGPALLGACALQPPHVRETLDAPVSWHNAPVTNEAPTRVERDGWWQLLGDPAVDALVAAGLRDSPTLAEAAARVDRAAAAQAAQDARRMPAIGIEGSLSQSRDRAERSGGTSTGQTIATLGARLSWELDLWGRVRASASAAQHRLTARTADAEAARLSVIGEIADTVLALRSCDAIRALRDRDIASREIELRISSARLSFGNIAPVAVVAAQSNLASARTERVAQQESCRRLINALVALSGMDAQTIRRALPEPARAAQTVPVFMPAPPPFVPALPATVLLGHAAVTAAEREVAARWSDIEVVRAESMPRIDLAAVLTGQWIRALGSNDARVSRSVSAGLSVPLIDGGAGSANVRGARAAYREAVAQLALAVRTAVREIEDGLAAQQSADERIRTASMALEAARFTLRANDARWRAGAIAQLELEDSRRQLNRAEESSIGAASDRARAWVALVRRAGTTWNGAPQPAPQPDEWKSQ